MKMSSIAAALLATTLSATVATPARGAVVGFTGPYGPGGWTTMFNGNLGAASGSANLTTTAVTLVGGNAVSPDPSNFVPACTGAIAGIAGACELRYVTTNIQNPFVFDWSYASADSAGAGDDLFGMLINGIRTQLSDPGGAISQSGHVSVSAGSSFGWYVNCTDCIEGAATVRITNFQAGVVPEPATIALLSAGVVAAGAARRRRGRASAS